MYHLTKEIFVIPQGKNYIIYAPLKNAFFKVNPATVVALQQVEKGVDFPEGKTKSQFIHAGVLIPKPEQPVTPKTFDDVVFEPEAVTIFNTSDCGLKCVYCYGNAGQNVKLIDCKTAYAAVDFVITNNIKHKSTKPIHIGFHGGGEPLYGKGFAIVKKVVKYAKAQCQKSGLNCFFSVASNGVLSKTQLDWIIKNINNITISIDGPPEIQDQQRPLKNGRASSAFVVKTIKYFEKNNFPFNFRATITKNSVNKLKSIIDYFVSIAPSVQSYHFEPLYECGRCKTSGFQAPSNQDFIAGMIDAIKYAKSLKRNLYYSGSDISRVTSYFCGALGKNFCVTPWGRVTSCFEVSLPNYPRSHLFTFGFYNQTSNSFEFDYTKLKKLLSRNSDNIAGCQDCFLKFSCAGDCPAKVVDLSDNKFLENDFQRCNINQKLALFKINQDLKIYRKQKGAINEKL